MSTTDTPPTLAEVRSGLEDFALEAAPAREVFAGRLEPDPNGSSWGWDSLRRKIRQAIEAMETGVSAWSADVQILEPAPSDVQEAVRLYEALRRAITAADFLVYGAANVPGSTSVDVDAFRERVLDKRDAMKALRARMETYADDYPAVAVRP